MSTGTDIIISALRLIGVHTVNSPAAPENVIFGMEQLNSMLELWTSRSIRFAYTPLAVPGDDLGEPADARNGIISNLSLYVAPAFDNGAQIVSNELRNSARRDFGQIRTLYQAILIPPKIISSTAPRGAGNSRGVLPRTFAGPGRAVDG